MSKHSLDKKRFRSPSSEKKKEISLLCLHEITAGEKDFSLPTSAESSVFLFLTTLAQFSLISGSSADDISSLVLSGVLAVVPTKSHTTKFPVSSGWAKRGGGGEGEIILQSSCGLSQ